MEEDNSSILVEKWKLKRLIHKLDTAGGNGTSMVSLVIPPKKQLSDITQKLTEEIGAASNIKSNIVRKSVLTAVTAARERLKLYNGKIPNNGLVLFCGEILADDGKNQKKVLIDFEPFRPVTRYQYLCDSSFHTDELKFLLEDDETFGFIVVDGNGVLYGKLQGNNKEIISKFNVELPKKHRKGGQSSVRFARLRLQARQNYVRKVCEGATNIFITNNKPNVAGLILAGSADFKTEIRESQLFDQRLKPKVLKEVDVSYGGENGFNQAVELSQDCLKNLKFIQEKKILTQFYEEIALDSGKVCFGLTDTMNALEAGAVETILLHDQIDYYRVTLKNKTTDDVKVIYLREEQLTDPKFYKDAQTNEELETEDTALLSEWLAENYNEFGAKLYFITDKSSEGFQFVKGFGGLGANLRYKLELDALNADNFDAKEDDEDDFI
mmetsp:Transcript_39981/g.35674  ORF Transcript_39981/g.35674 Transcript_39981/m.35674 type:complete len:439 (+) Transcript_39981:70-1386(+)